VIPRTGSLRYFSAFAAICCIMRATLTANGDGRTGWFGLRDLSW